MIIAIVLTFAINTVGAVMAMLNAPVITELPWGTDAALTQAFNVVYGAWDALWPIQAIIFATGAFLGYKAFMVWLQVFLGHRISHG